MTSLVSKDEPLKTSMVNIGYLVLKELAKQEDKRISFLDLAEKLKHKGITEHRPIMYALIFLHTSGSLEFKAPYLYQI